MSIEKLSVSSILRFELSLIGELSLNHRNTNGAVPELMLQGNAYLLFSARSTDLINGTNFGLSISYKTTVNEEVDANEFTDT